MLNERINVISLIVAIFYGGLVIKWFDSTFQSIRYDTCKTATFVRRIICRYICVKQLLCNIYYNVQVEDSVFL